jgi:hypothetical protein
LPPGATVFAVDEEAAMITDEEAKALLEKLRRRAAEHGVHIEGVPGGRFTVFRRVGGAPTLMGTDWTLQNVEEWLDIHYPEGVRRNRSPP